tara:strand:+ start:733 stop:1731 length:999 start_codon:yes stop_codon:yes gene_type:complete
MSNKSEKINRLKNDYNKNVRELYLKIINIINYIKRLRINGYRKRIIINWYVKQYYSSVNKLRIKLNADIAAIQSIVEMVETPSANYKAVLVGINYTGTRHQLNGCINDVETFKQELIKIGFKHSEINVLTDLTRIKATRQHILNSFTRLLKTSREGETIVFGYSGHGTFTRDKTGDETDGNDECIVPCDLNLIIDDELKTIIESTLPKGVTLVCFFDSCHSGTMLDLPYSYLAESNYETLITNNKTTNTKGNVIMISGCMDAQTSMDSYVTGNWAGAMTSAFEFAVNKPENDTWGKLIVEMNTYIMSNDYTQRPQLSICGPTCSINDKHSFK